MGTRGQETLDRSAIDAVAESLSGFTHLCCPRRIRPSVQCFNADTYCKMYSNKEYVQFIDTTDAVTRYEWTGKPLDCKYLPVAARDARDTMQDFVNRTQAINDFRDCNVALA